MNRIMRPCFVGVFALAALAVSVSPVAAQVNGFINPYVPFGAQNPNLPQNPYVPNPNFPGGNPYSGNYGNYPIYSLYSGPPFGEILFGQADILRAYGMALTSQEQARIMRQQAIQAGLDTQRKAFELQMYIKANTPTFTEEQEKIARTTLRRIQNNSTAAEVASGKSLNLMLDDVRKFANRNVSANNIPLNEDVLLKLNVTSGETSLGLLRDGGKINWPIGLQEIIPAEKRRTLETQAQALVQGAEKGNVDPNVLKDFSSELERIYDKLVNNITEVGPHYLEAKRFVNDLREARTALERGQAQHQLAYMKWIRNGNKTMQDVVDYMIANGLRFAPATVYDEAAYRAFFSALVAYDVALNAQGPIGGDPNPER